eukprot:scaffold6931_cov443-Prasinococcus_capsulatus_cf.AAC.11
MDSLWRQSLILGALPTSEEFMRSMKEAEGVRAVVTLNEPYEFVLAILTVASWRCLECASLAYYQIAKVTSPLNSKPLLPCVRKGLQEGPYSSRIARAMP